LTASEKQLLSAAIIINYLGKLRILDIIKIPSLKKNSHVKFSLTLIIQVFFIVGTALPTADVIVA